MEVDDGCQNRLHELMLASCDWGAREAKAPGMEAQQCLLLCAIGAGL